MKKKIKIYRKNKKRERECIMTVVNFCVKHVIKKRERKREAAAVIIQRLVIIIIIISIIIIIINFFCVFVFI